ncbi:restriction endonuclease subunit S [Streptomyces sp. NPDC001732]
MSTEPDEIRWVPVGEVGEVRMGKQLSPASSQADGMHAPYLRVANVLDGWIDYSDVKTMSFNPLEWQKYGLEPGDILLNEGQSLELVGRSAIYEGRPGRYCFQNTLIRFRSGSSVIPEYAIEVFRAWLSDGTFASIAKKTTSIAHLGGDRFANLLFPLPPMEDQRRIVEIMNAVRESERVTEAGISKLRTLKSSFVEESVAAIGCWAPLGDRLDRIDAGHSPNLPGTPASPGEWGVLKVSAINQMGFRASENKRIIDSALIDERCEVFAGDLIIARASTADLVGRTCVVTDSPFRLLLSDKTLRIVENRNLANRRYVDICFGLSQVRRQIEGLSSGISQGMQNITQGAIERILLPWVPLVAQGELVAQVDAIEDRIRVEVSALEGIRSLRAGLIGALLGGVSKATS